MANYGNAIYGLSKYGSSPLLAYSVEPMALLVTDFHEAYVYWKIPTGAYSAVRLVRNQSSYPETAEDGIIVYQASTATLAKYVFNDGGGVEDLASTPALVPGKPLYYRMFLFTDPGKTWVDAGSVEGIRVLVDVQGLFAKRYDAQSGSAWLVRPDQHIAARWRRFELQAVEQALRVAMGSSIVAA
jgi:hypothetical protein